MCLHSTPKTYVPVSRPSSSSLSSSADQRQPTLSSSSELAPASVPGRYNSTEPEPVPASVPGRYDVTQPVPASVPGRYSVTQPVPASVPGRYDVTQPVPASVPGRYDFIKDSTEPVLAPASVPGRYDFIRDSTQPAPASVPGGSDITEPARGHYDFIRNAAKKAFFESSPAAATYLGLGVPTGRQQRMSDVDINMEAKINQYV